MTVRLVAPAVIDSPIIRPSARVSTVAQLLNDDPRQIRRMVERGDLEGHRQGKRGVRIFLDSVEAWQRDQAFKGRPAAAGKAAQPPAQAMSGATKAAHRRAVAHLQALGLVRVSRP